MERNLSLENRLSFNRPIAESTLRASSSNSPSFQWGRKNLNSNESIRNRTLSPVGNRNGISKIDARIYADVQSRGLTSRIVKYHENSTRLNRSISMNNLSSEIKQFPTVRSSKPAIPYKASKQNVSMTHIAPPDKSAFYGNTLSGLLRSSSVITLQHNDDDISSENRPIIHPPVTEKEMQPTRSVLEVLKEISRKRINNEDADEGETSKKYCNRIENEFNGTMQPDYRSAILQASHSYKRQRESAVECLNSIQHEQQTFVSKQQRRQEVPSPEQQTAKRRNCNYNNDITSSLSSSKKSHNKRKLFDSEGEKQQEKQLRYQPEIRLPELSTALSYVTKTPITPLPNTPQTSKSLSGNEPPLPTPIQKSISTPISTDVIVKPTNQNVEKPKLTLFNKNYNLSAEESMDEPVFNEDDNGCAGIQFVKPKKSVSSISGSQLLIERTQKSKLAMMLSGLRGELYLGDEEEKIVEAPSKKLEEKQVESTQEQTKPVESEKHISNNDNPVTTLSTSTTTIMGTVTSTTTTSSTSTVDAASATRMAITLPISKPNTSTLPTKITSPLTGIKLTPQTTLTAVAATTTIITSIASITPPFSFGIATTTLSTTTTNSTGTKPSIESVPNNTVQNNTAMGVKGFSFGESKKSESKVPISNQQILPTLGTITGQNKTSAFTINTPATTTSAVSVIATTSAPTMPPVFSFNANNMSSTVASKSAAQTSTGFSTTTTTLTFPASQSTSTAQSSTLLPASTTSNSTPFSLNKLSGGFSFSATTSAGTTSNVLSATDATKAINFTVQKATTSSGGFSFGGTATENKSTSAGGKPLDNTAATPIKFGASVLTAQQPQMTRSEPPAFTSTFVFGSKPTNSTETSSKNANTFGTLAGNQNQPFSFGSATPNKTTAESTMTTNIFSLQNTTPSKTFSFGGAATNTTTVPITTTTNTFSIVPNNNNSNNKPASIFSFGGDNNNSTSSSEGPKQSNSFNFAGNTQNKPFAFTGLNAEAQKSTFGSDQSKSFSFGSTNSSSSNVIEAPRPNGFNFPTGNQNNTFSFGGIGNKSSTTEQPKIAGNTQTNATPSNTFTFGTAKSPLGQVNAFSTPPNSGQSNVFNFSGGNNNTLQATATNVPVVKPNNPSFNGFSSNTQLNTFNFGSSNNNGVSTTDPAKPTAFSMTSNAQKPASTFMFGNASNNNTVAQNGNLFTIPNNNNSTLPPPAFNTTASTTSTAPNSNIFAVPPSSDRPIRRATRRLTKS